MDENELAAWALLGDPYLQCPIPLRDLLERIRQAVARGKKENVADLAAAREALRLIVDRDIRDYDNDHRFALWLQSTAKAALGGTTP